MHDIADYSTDAELEELIFGSDEEAAFKSDQTFIFYLLITAAGVVPCGDPTKVSPYTIHSADYIISFGLLRSVRIFRVSNLYV